MKPHVDIGTRRGALAARMGALCMLSIQSSFANTVNVANCSDSGAGSLRSAVQSFAADGDTVDLRQLPALGCSKITLTTGAIPVLVDNLTILGPDSNVTVTGKLGRNPPESAPIFAHPGAGTLKLTHLDIRDGNLSAPDWIDAYGGCIYSNGTVYLLRSTVQSCVANGSSHSRGGGISAKHLIAKYSTISGNTVGGASVDEALGGGVYVIGQSQLSFSTISGNHALTGPSLARTVGGGAAFTNNVSIFASTISGNDSQGYAGGLFLGAGYSPLPTVTITNSTISDNSADLNAGIYSFVSLVMQNSTVAFNKATEGTFLKSPGLAEVILVPNTSVVLQSTLIANNTYAGTNLDFSTLSPFNYGFSLSGANNLIEKSFSAVPAGTLTNVCPRLGALRDNGGPTRTHALLSRSPAIDAGNDNAIDPISHQPYVNDQRGVPRVDHGVSDIGAYEVQQGDIVFDDAFDACG